MRTLFLFQIIFLLLSLGKISFAAVESDLFDKDLVSELAKEDQWLRLGYYKKTLMGSWESQLDGPSYFLNANGKNDPEAELKTTIEQMVNADSLLVDESLSVQCRFPARKVWIEKRSAELGKPIRISARSCPRFQRWFDTLRGVSVSLVFSSYFLNNPSSTFGHTLLRINKAPRADGSRFALLDYGVNFAANPDTSNAVFYALKGLFGGFAGTFTTVPYYYKVREYSNAESRDLWEYELNINQFSTDFLVAHIWELGPTYADYWYLTENCSYFMLALLEVADPNLHLDLKLNKFVLPTDTVKLVYETPCLVKGVHFRPSVRTELTERLRNLSRSEKDLLAVIVDRKEFNDDNQRAFKSIPEDRQRLILDAAIDDLDYLYALEVQKTESPEWRFKNEILKARSQIPIVSQALHVTAPEMEAPHEGHGSRRWGFGFRNSNEKGAMGLFSYRFTFHDILDPLEGFPEYAQIGFFNFQFSYLFENKEIELEKLDLFEVMSLSPYSQFSRSQSWGFKLGYEHLINEQCWGCRSFGATGGLGYSAILSEDPRILANLGIKLASFYTPKTDSGLAFPHLLLGIGPQITLRARWNRSSTTLIEAWYRKDLNVEYLEYKELSLSHQLSFGKNDGLRMTGVNRWFERSLSVEYFHYY